MMHGLPRMTLAALAGYGAVVAVGAAGTAAAVFLFPQSASAPPTTPFLSMIVAVGFLGAVVAGYISARLAPSGTILVTMALLILMYLGTTVVVSRVGLAADARQPFGFLPLVTLLGVIGAWAGAMTERAVHGTQTR